MALDDLVETLAFGRTKQKVTSCLGMYLGPETIYIADTHLAGDKTVVDQLVRVPVPQSAGPSKPGAGPATATLSTDFLSDNGALAAAIRQAMAQSRWSTKSVMVTLSHHLGLLRYFTMPAIDKRFWKTAIPMEAKKYIPIPFDTLNHDYQVTALPPDASGRPRQGALVAVTQAKNLADIAALLGELGLAVAGLEVAPCSVLRMWQTLEKGPRDQPYCQVHFDGGAVRILIADKGLPVFFREVFLGEEAAVTDQRKIDLGGCVSFAVKQLAVSGVPQVRVSGSGASLPAWREAFAQETGLPVTAQDTPGLLGIKAGDWGGYAALGASLRQQVPAGATTLDLSAVGRISDAERSVARDIFLAAGALSAFLLLMGLWRMGSLHFKSRDLAKYARDPELQAVLVGKSPAGIDEMMRSMQEQVELGSQTGGTAEVKLTEVLKDVVEGLPEKVWLTKLSYSDPLPRSERSAAEIALSGHAVGDSLSQEQDLSFQFRDRLIASPSLGKRFTDLQAAISGKPFDAESVKGLSPDALAEKLEDRTELRIVGKAKR